ncbi:unnamed protein product [Psylliodes chrysocephalus]|uniref:SHSP domain-containing protein n=1 Tax=Psylliodes chrysocephalus TaxID=3402493 RepID=A0A9P0CJC9_9CUCU|nr:unnamed protein product [Psylliodes chrysocephala]
MSLIPLLFDDSAYFLRPSRVMDQHFGMMLDPDLLQPINLSRLLLRSPAGYIRNWMSAASKYDSGSTYGKDQFIANLDVQQFKPDEISVKITDENTITIEGKHEEKEDEHGHIFRHFVRKYTLPKNYNISQMQSKLSSDGVLTITAPRIDVEQIECKNIPIIQTGEPVKSIEEKKNDKQK